MPQALSPFSRDIWRNTTISQEYKLRWLRDSLEGLGTLHASGFMHRDIRPQNLLILSYEPPRASICDYGKVVKAENSTDTVIGPIHSLAPEVWTADEDSPYDAKIDLWALGYAMAELWGYSVQRYPGSDGFTVINPPITYNRHTAILEMLRAHRDNTPEDASLVDLVFKLLEWDPKQRYSAERALEHHCWTSKLQEDSVEAGPSRTKRSQLKVPSSNIVSTPKNTLEASVSATVSTPETEEVTQETLERFRRQFEG